MTDTIEITIPPNAFTIKYAESGTETKWTFGACSRWIVDTHPRFNSTGPGIRQGARILAAIDGAEELSKSKPLARDDGKAFSEALETPTSGYHPPLASTVDGKETKQTIPARVFLPYLDAVADALK